MVKRAPIMGTFLPGSKEHSMKKVRDTAAGKKIGVHVVLDGARHVATIHVYHGASVRVDVITTEALADERNVEAYMRDHGVAEPPNLRVQQGRASGYGYDREAAAMAGLYVDGIQLRYHCETDGTLKRLLTKYHKEIDKCSSPEECKKVSKRYEAKAAAVGADFENYHRRTPTGERIFRYAFVRDGGEAWSDAICTECGDIISYSGPAYEQYGSISYRPGLDGLRCRGYTVITAI